MTLKALVALPLAVAFSVSCGSRAVKESSAEPNWVHQATRTVDGGYIVYVGRGEARTLEAAQFKAEGVALEDLANECSMIARGTRIEDRYVETHSEQKIAWVKIALEFQTCDQASRTVEPTDIRRLANENFTQELHRYQEFEETGAVPPAGEKAEIAEADSAESSEGESTLAPTSGGGTVQFVALRQYVSYQKQVVILSPADTYAPGSTRAVHFVSVVQPSVNQLAAAVATNPTYRTQPPLWSATPIRPVVVRPLQLRPIAVQRAAIQERIRARQAVQGFNSRAGSRMGENSSHPVAPFVAQPKNVRRGQNKARGQRRCKSPTGRC